MRCNIKAKQTKESPEEAQEPFSLYGTLDQYEVEELNAREIADLIAKRYHHNNRRARQELA